MNNAFKQFFFAAGIFLPLVFAQGAFAAISGDLTTFNVDKNFEVSENLKVQSVLVKTSPNLYFYVEKIWWELQPSAKQNEILGKLDALSVEFDNNIYPTLTSVFGLEWRPGVDGDARITLLFHQMKDGAVGYFRSADGYVKLQIPDSNEREMVYLSLANIESPQLKSFLAHEFTHVITFNQKDRKNGIQEDVWLNEARADYAPTILGYDSVYEGSNLQKRVRDFLNNPSDSITEWQGKKYDYAVANVFMHYLVDHYGINILSDSLKLKSIGIVSLNEILLKNGYAEDFSRIFTDWTIANIINNCVDSTRYCYLTSSLKNIRISPTLNFLPLTGNSSLSVANVTKYWAGNWQKIIGGNGDLVLEFSTLAGVNFKVPYIIFDKDNNYSIHMLALDSDRKGRINIKGFGEKYSSLIIIPSLQGKLGSFFESELAYLYTFKVSISGQVQEDEAVIIQQLLAQIELLKKQIAAITGGTVNATCGTLNHNLYAGVFNSVDVRCLQQFLAGQDSAIYPQALVTGFFGSLTRAAVVRFQAKFQIPQTGFVGILTRAKINLMLNGG
ncbi:MAG: hypothetical protein EXS48_01250 [Candidatus Staskawiczbacteria bacterium]|nr:hypothetical protein [Candidatus Staskawiczbacteria bacterium]